ncbi:MAG: hypothetical protein MUO76_22155 [Anaerolineaceae bacterium]|nr:hypothetical protein [Anaerolineaceae bacterium]
MLIKQKTPKKRISIKDLIFAPFGCLLQVSPILSLLIIILLFLLVTYLYTTLNIDPFGYGAAGFEELIYSSSLDQITNNEQYVWEISYEGRRDTKYTGFVRHISPIRMSDFPVLSHDILITTGDFSDHEFVRTTVMNHKFTWLSTMNEPPTGMINLLHTVPLNAEIYKQLIKIKSGAEVSIHGVEIQTINYYDPEGNLLSWWQDQGCNSFLVKSVEIKE